jgi:hypothetical protein
VHKVPDGTPEEVAGEPFFFLFFLLIFYFILFSARLSLFSGKGVFLFFSHSTCENVTVY